MKSYPIWMDVTSCIYKGSKSYGVKEDGLTSIFVGSSAKNSHHFADVRITHRDMGKQGRSFHLYVDGQLIKEGIVRGHELQISEAPKLRPDFEKAVTAPVRPNVIATSDAAWLKAIAI